MRRVSQKIIVYTLGIFLVVATFNAILSPVGSHAQSTLVVPTNFPTIQSAVNAASPGDTVQVLSGTYTEQVTISKDLTLIGSGADSTFIKAPAATLTPDSFGRTYIVEVNNAAVVTMSGVTVAGPGPGGCRSLDFGISVVSGGTLQLRDSVVTHIHGSPIAFCFPSGTGIAIGLPPFIAGGTFGHGTIENVKVNDYQFNGILVTGSRTTATVSDNLITGQGTSQPVINNGITVRFGAAALGVTDNTVSGNNCNVPPPFPCGTDIVTQIQAAGVLVFPNGAGTVISDNNAFNNDVGIYVVGTNNCCTTSDNTLTNNIVAGIILQDGTNTASDNTISGGNFGIAVAALDANTVGILHDNTITGTSIAAVQELSCCGFTATAIVLN